MKRLLALAGKKHSLPLSLHLHLSKGGKKHWLGLAWTVSGAIRWKVGLLCAFNGKLSESLGPGRLERFLPRTPRHHFIHTQKPADRMLNNRKVVTHLGWRIAAVFATRVGVRDDGGGQGLVEVGAMGNFKLIIGGIISGLFGKSHGRFWWSWAHRELKTKLSLIGDFFLLNFSYSVFVLFCNIF